MLRIKLNIIFDNQLDKTRKEVKIKKLTKVLRFKDLNEFLSYKQLFYIYLIQKGWKHHRESANQMYKNKMVLTPFFIKD